MSAYIGSTAIGGVYVGSTAASKVYLGTTEVWSASVPVSIVGSATAAAASVTMPAHQVGDIIVAYAFRTTATTTPTKPTAAGTVPNWQYIDFNTGANLCSSCTAYFVATATNHTSGTWGNTAFLQVVVLRGQNVSTPIGGHDESGGTGTSIIAPAVTMSRTDGTSALLHFYGGRSITSWASAPTGYTRLTQNTTGVAVNSKNDTTSDGSIAQGTQTSTGYRGATVEIVAI